MANNDTPATRKEKEDRTNRDREEEAKRDVEKVIVAAVVIPLLFG